MIFATKKKDPFNKSFLFSFYIGTLPLINPTHSHTHGSLIELILFHTILLIITLYNNCSQYIVIKFSNPKLRCKIIGSA